MVTLNHLGLITQGEHWIETPVGKVKASYLGDNKVQIENVDSYRLKKDVILEVEGLGVVSGDIAWGGNWFFLTHAAPCDITPQNIPALTKAAWAIRKRLSRLNITGERGAEIDHIEFFQSSRSPHSDSINFVLCPGGAYDRSPCGTGTSAKLACLAADGHLKPDKRWTQESVIGSKFEGIYQRSAVASRIVPQITGQAYVYADGRLILDPNDPFLHGIK
jgi:4-hydroxyproline epimerase